MRSIYMNYFEETDYSEETDYFEEIDNSQKTEYSEETDFRTKVSRLFPKIRLFGAENSVNRSIEETINRIIG